MVKITWVNHYQKQPHLLPILMSSVFPTATYSISFTT